MRLEFGICMEGFEHRFARLVQKLWPTEGAYLEIGLAHGKTFRAVSTLLAYRCGDDWHAVGIDPAPLFSGFHRNQIVLPFKSEECVNGIKLHAPYALVLIDGCHCDECCADDFRRVAPHVQTGGFVLFHDYAPEQQGMGAQGYHDDRPINVRKAVDYLKTLPRFQKEWREHREWVGDRRRRNVANMGVFEKL